MTDQLDTTAIPRWLHSQNGAMVPARPDADDHEKCRLYVRAVDYDALCAEVDRLNAAIVRQAGAAKTLRESTLAEVQYLKDQDRSEYHAAASLDSERLANEILTDESGKLRAENERLRAALMSIERIGIAHSDSFARQIKEAQDIASATLRALAQKGGE